MADTVQIEVPESFGDLDLPVQVDATHDERLDAARRVAQWEIGSPVWADTLIGAYLNPRDANDEMDVVGAD